MNFYLFVLLSFSIFAAALAGLYRFGKVHAAYHPFIIFTVLASLNELCSYVIVTSYALPNTANNNIYTLAEAMILCRQFYKWDLLTKKKSLYWLLQISLVIIWMYDFYKTGDIFLLFHRYRIYYTVVLALLCLGGMNKIIFGSTRSLLKSTRFLVCICLIILYTFKIITELFWLYGITGSDAFLFKVYESFVYINLIINCFFFLAVIWIPKKPRYIIFT